MAIRGGPDIIEDGLVLHLDAADRNSYPGTGSTWYDLSGQGNHLYWTSPAPTFTTYQNTPVIDTTNISSSLRAAITTTYNGLRTGTETYSCCSFFRPNSTTSNKILFSFGPANNTCSSQNRHPIAIGSSGRFVGSACGGAGTWTSSAGAIPTTEFWFVCTTYDGTTEKVYVNGVLDKSAAMTNVATPVSSNNKFSLGWIRDDGANYSMSAKISNISVYNNKVLTANEVQQNYNAIKGRFGL